MCESVDSHGQRVDGWYATFIDQVPSEWSNRMVKSRGPIALSKSRCQIAWSLGSNRMGKGSVQVERGKSRLTDHSGSTGGHFESLAWGPCPDLPLGVPASHSALARVSALTQTRHWQSEADDVVFPHWQSGPSLAWKKRERQLAFNLKFKFPLTGIAASRLRLGVRFSPCSHSLSHSCARSLHLALALARVRLQLRLVA